MKVLVLSLFIASIVIVHAGNKHAGNIEDNEFAEFEDFDDTEKQTTINNGFVEFEAEQVEEKPTNEVEDVVVETEEDEEFESLDPDEFEGLPGDDTIWENDKKVDKNIKKKKPELKIADVPLHLRSWDKYYVEILMALGIFVYLINFFIGKAKNNTLASSWLSHHLDFLHKSFALVGDDPQNKKIESTNELQKESEHVYTLWCSGRQCCEGMLVELKLLKRQDLISVIAHQMKPINDQVTISVKMTTLPSLVFCVGIKKSITNLHKTMQDLCLYCADKAKMGEKYNLPLSMLMLSELYGDVPAFILDSTVVRVLKDHQNLFDSLHISDQYSGAKPLDQNDDAPAIPETVKQITLVINLPEKPSEIGEMVPLLKMLIYLSDKLKKLRLSRDSQIKADKHRADVADRYLKQTHAQRQEAAQQKKEEKARALKERMMNEEDPEKQRRLDEMIQRKEQNKKNKKMMKGRQYKVKAM
uniref:coiled-coil domain-containing protein 47-like n=1 Tax=Ciona intestinalis TaxID=7719 RepID=UPI0000525319|nr:coiled-coil domain-containing protein 47-like [Ciona intestinalis]|eukprot:XP_002128684.1 coiled-coil domain-containing protein 47-like [Ciona intestinalis]